MKRGGAAVAPSGGEQLLVKLEDESCHDPWGSGGSFGGILGHREGRQRNIETVRDADDSAETSSFPPMSGVPEVAFAAEAAEVVRNLLGGRAAALDEICTKVLQALNIVGLSWLTGHHGQRFVWIGRQGGSSPSLTKGNEGFGSKHRGLAPRSLLFEIFSGAL